LKVSDMDKTALLQYCDDYWEQHIVPTLSDYIRIPALSVDFDPDWQAHGQLDKARDLAMQWLQAHAPAHWRVMDKSLPHLTPLIMIEIPGDSDNTTLIYGHLDKQPEMEGWWQGYGPWQPRISDNKLYGRGGADDGYALFAAVTAVKALQQQQLAHDRIVVLIEFSEESGSPHLPQYLDTCREIIGTPRLVIALDSGTGDYERLWSTTSLRGMLRCQLTVNVLSEATHSGIASGIVPDSMRIMRSLLERVEDSATGQIKLAGLHCEIPPQRRQQAQATAEIIGSQLMDSFNTVDSLSAICDDSAELLLNNTWRPTLCVVGQKGLPLLQDAGNVLRAYTCLKLSFRLPPSLSIENAKVEIEKALTRDIPYSAKVALSFDQGGQGWDAPALSSWLDQASEQASQAYYGKSAQYIGLGASIPFMSMLGMSYPKAQFLITGVLGPKSNAHGPNEFIHIPYAKKLTACVAYILAHIHNAA